MSLLNAFDLSFHYPSTPDLFHDVSLSVNPKDRLALVGPNGAGKSSLLLVLAGELQPTSGRIVRRNRLSIAQVHQETPDGARDTALFDYVLSAHTDPEDYAAESRTERILEGLGFARAEFPLSVARLSGGQRTRAALARALFTPADLLLLDEPTNHLDISGRQWLEQELLRRDSACVMISHDRTLLRRVATRVVEIQRGELRIFEGGYDEYIARRELLERQAWENYNAGQRREAAALRASERRAALAVQVATAPPGERGARDFYGRKAKKVARTARILKERVERDPVAPKPWVEHPMPDLDFSAVRRSGDITLSVRGLGKSFGERALFSDLSFELKRGQRLAIAGRNGCGKTTLLRMIAGLDPPDTGEIRIGSNVTIGHFAQSDIAPPDDGTANLHSQARTLLACLKLRPDRVTRPLRELSPGERAKVALARLLLSGANLLLLDEPTNHMEVEAQPALEQALARFPGTMIVVSHDRSFLEGLGELTTIYLTPFPSRVYT